MDMNNMCCKVWRTIKSEKGQGLVEYALILVLIAVVVIAALNMLGGKTNNVLSTVSSTLTPK